MDFKPTNRRHVPRHNYIRVGHATPPAHQPVPTPKPKPETAVPTSTLESLRPPVKPSVSSKPIIAGVGISYRYTSNPFLSTVKGLVVNLEHNPIASLASGLIGIIGTGVIYGAAMATLFSTGSAIAIVIGASLIAVWLIICIGVFYCISASSINKEELTIEAYFRRSIKKFFPFLALMIISFFLTIIGLVLLIVPGVYFVGRSCMAPLIMFTENLGPIESLSRSFHLSKGHVNEMLGSLFAGMFIGESYYSLLFGAISVSPIVGRYMDLVELEESKMQKPKIHPLNFLYLIALFFTVAILAVVVLIAIVAGNQDEVMHTGFYLNTKTDTYQTSITPGNPTIPK